MEDFYLSQNYTGFILHYSNGKVFARNLSQKTAKTLLAALNNFILIADSTSYVDNINIAKMFLADVEALR